MVFPSFFVPTYIFIAIWMMAIICVILIRDILQFEQIIYWVPFAIGVGMILSIII